MDWHMPFPPFALWADAALNWRPKAAGVPRTVTLRGLTTIAALHMPTAPRRLQRSTARAAFAMLHRAIVNIDEHDLRTDAIVIAAAAAASEGRQVHVVCLSSARARAAHDRAGGTLHALGLQSAVIDDGADYDLRSEGYRCRIVFLSVARLAQDLLRDQVEAASQIVGRRASVRRLASRINQTPPLVPEQALALVDDADLVMLEALRPVKFAETADPVDGRRYADQAFAILSALDPEVHYRIDPSTLRILLTAEGTARTETFAMLFGGAWADPVWRDETILSAIAIRDMFRDTTDYRIENGTIRLNRGLGSGGAEPSIPQLIAAKERLPAATGAAYLSDTRRTFARYKALGGAGAGVDALRKEFAYSYGLRVVGRAGYDPLPPPAICSNRDALRRALGGLLVQPNVTLIWAPTRDDAADLPPALAACRLLVGEDAFGVIDDPACVIQIAAAQANWERRIRQSFPRARHHAFVCPGDGVFRLIDPEDRHLAAFARHPDLPRYRAAQQALARAASEKRLAHLRSESYFSNVLGFLGEAP